MKVEPNTLEELKVFGTPIKELTKEKNSAFQELSSVKDILNPVTELVSEKGFAELSGIKDIATPVKELIPKGEEKSSSQESKEEKSSSQESKEEKSSSQEGKEGKSDK